VSEDGVVKLAGFFFFGVSVRLLERPAKGFEECFGRV
jgi:hypothetical protein